MQTVKAYILALASICAIINMIVNPLVSWIGNRAMRFTPLTGILVDMAITCLVMSTLIALFTIPGVRRDIKAGKIRADDRAVRAAGLLSHLPRSWWALGLLLGAGFAVVLVPVTCGVAVILGLPGLTFGWLVLLKIVYTGAVAFAVTRWLILRQLEADL
jgi:hypothetical protein